MNGIKQFGRLTIFVAEPLNEGRVIGRSLRFSGLRAELAHFPGVARVQEFVQVAWTTLGDDVLYLLVHDVFVARQIVPRAKHADWRGEAGAMLHVREQKGIRRTRMMRVMNN